MKKTTLLAALGLLAALAFGPPPVQAAVTEAWVHRYSNVVSNSNDKAVKVVRDAAGDIIVTGTTDDRIHGSDMLTTKYSGTDGSVLWQNRYNGPANSDDRAKAVAVDGSGNVVVTGSSTGTNGYYDYYTTKYAAADGALLWQKRGPGGVASAAAVDGGDNVVVTGYSYGTNGYYDYYTAKYATADGAVLWEKHYSERGVIGQASAVAVDGSGNVVVTGVSYTGWTDADSDYYTAKYASADGALLWEKRYNGPANSIDQAQPLAVDGSGNVVVAGYSWGGANGYDYYTAKYAAADGALLWERRYNGPAHYNDQANAVTVDGSDNVVVTGYSYNTNFNADYYTAKYAATNGSLLWEQRYNGPGYGYDVAQAVAVDGSGNVVVTGSSSRTNGPADFYTAKYASADGALLWQKRYDGPSNTGGQAQAVTVDGSGNAVVTGYSGQWPNCDYYTAKYAAADGALVWEQRYNGLSKSYNEAKAVVVDGSGNLVVTGYSEGNGGSRDYYTAKYAAADGALLWEKRSNGLQNYLLDQRLAVDGSGNVVMLATSPGLYYIAKYATNGALLWEKGNNGSGNGCYAQAVAVDGSGNVLVTGYSNNGPPNYDNDYYTGKYAAADGVLLWEKRYNGPANSDDRANAVAVDGTGDVVVTGSIDGSGNSYENSSDYYTAKYATADGALLWEKRYNGPANKRDQAQAVAVDACGNVVVTGISDAIFDCNDCYWQGDYYTAKYAAADGSLLWEKRYSSPTNAATLDASFDNAKAAAVDGSGNVLVTGSSYNGTNSDYYTAKYAAADGALLWEQHYNADGYYGYYGTQAVAVDGGDNVVVTGGINSDYYTAKYAAADGALLWEKRYNGPANGDDRVAGLALGPNGLAAVTGTSTGDYATVVYRDDVYPISIALVPGGVRLGFIGIPGRSYTIERAPAVTGPWTTLNTQIAPASGLLEYQDAAPHSGSSFYRTVQP